LPGRSTRDDSGTITLIGGIIAKLLLQPDDAGVYGLDFSLDHHPALTLTLRGKLLADDQRLEVDILSFTLQLALAAGRRREGRWSPRRSIWGQSSPPHVCVYPSLRP
jgi:hypothetical protein